MKIGDELNDGIIFHINEDGKSGLIAQKQDLPGKYNWDNAITACNELGNGYRLPNKEELNLLYQQMHIIGGFANYNYWSSTEYDSNYAWYQSFGYGSQGSYGKGNTVCVRAIRAF